MTNVTKIAFKGKRIIELKPFFQYDYGQILRFIDLILPETFEVHFSNYERGTATVVNGANNEVDIPNELFQTGLPIYVWIFLHTDQDDGRTAYMITIPVKPRAKIEENTDT